MKAITFKPDHHKLFHAVALGFLALAATQAWAVNNTFSDIGMAV